jgi:tetratricopeptide (TPR) repeat protein
LISRRLFEGLKIELESLSPADRANFQPQVWHDSLDISQKRTPIGVIAGKTAEERWKAACILAAPIHAQVMIYGNLPAEGSAEEFIPEFAVCQDVNLRLDADEIVGAQPLIQGIPAQLITQMGRPDTDLAVNLRVNSWTQALSLFSIGIMYDLQGRSDLALRIFQQARDQLKNSPEMVGEVLWFFLGREELTLSVRTSADAAENKARLEHLSNARAAFEEALRRNPTYARAQIGLGGVFFSQAQDTPPGERLQKPDLGAALRAYQQAVTLAPGSPGALIEPKARLGLASAHILEG